MTQKKLDLSQKLHLTPGELLMYRGVLMRLESALTNKKGIKKATKNWQEFLIFACPNIDLKDEALLISFATAAGFSSEDGPRTFLEIEESQRLRTLAVIHNRKVRRCFNSKAVNQALFDYVRDHDGQTPLADTMILFKEQDVSIRRDNLDRKLKSGEIRGYVEGTKERCSSIIARKFSESLHVELKELSKTQIASFLSKKIVLDGVKRVVDGLGEGQRLQGNEIFTFYDSMGELGALKSETLDQALQGKIKLRGTFIRGFGEATTLGAFVDEHFPEASRVVPQQEQSSSQKDPSP